MNGIIKLFLFCFALFWVLVGFTIYGPWLYLEFKTLMTQNTTKKEVITKKDYDPLIHKENSKVVVPVDFNYSLAIPKLNINVGVRSLNELSDPENLDPLFEKGIVEISGASRPGKNGEIRFLVTPVDKNFESLKYNKEFYLLHWLKQNDEIYVTYDYQLYKYRVTGVKITSFSDSEKVSELTSSKPKLKITTNWPPGINWFSLEVRAVLDKDN